MRQNENRPRVIHSPKHPLVSRILSLQTRAGRERTGLFYIDGVRAVARAARHGVRIDTLVVATDLPATRFGRQLVGELRQAGTPCQEVTPELFRRFSLAEEPQGIGAVIRQRWETLERLPPWPGLCWVALAGVRSPGNLGTILRTCDAVGVAGIILLDPTIDPYDPVVTRASMGSIFSLQIARSSLAELVRWKTWHGCQLVGTSPTAPVDYHAVTYSLPVVLLMGPERHGLSREQQKSCDCLVKIPMVGDADSLNLAVATGVLLYELFNQHRAVPENGEG